MCLLKTTGKMIGSVLVIVVFLWLAGGIAYLTKIGNSRPELPKAKTEAIIVLTGGPDRIKTGLSLWADGMAPELFISGVHLKTSRNDIFAQWDHAEKRLPFCCMTLGYDATSTVENAVEVKDWIERNAIRHVRLVTSDYHIPRAAMELEKLMPDVRFIIHPVLETQQRMNSAHFRYVVFEEYHKYLWRIFQINTGYKGEPWKLL